MKLDFNQLISQLQTILTQLIGLALLLLIASAIAAKYGLRVSVLPVMDGQALAYLCGAWWLYRGRS